jgi:predicted amidohydrolase
MTSPDLYVPEGLPGDFSATKADRDFAIAFEAIAGLLEAAKDPGGVSQSERLMLLLSSCRNGYLTVNALFTDLVEVFGYGRSPSLLKKCIDQLESADTTALRTTAGEICANLAFFDGKLEVWSGRDSLHQILEATLASLPLLQRDQAKAIIRNVRQRSGHGKSSGWNRVYYELTTDEPSHITERLRTLCEVRDTARGIAGVALCLVPFANAYGNTNAEPSQRTLFSETSPYDPAADWPPIFESLWQNAGALGLSQHGNGSDPAVAWHDSAGKRQQVSKADLAIAPGLTKLLVSRLRECEQRSYERLAEFKPNLGEPPLPEPYRIDLTPPSAATSLQDGDVTIDVKDLHAAMLPAITIALPRFGVPLDYFNRDSFRYGTEAQRQEARLVAVAATNAAGNSGANAIVFPEYFLPRSCVEEVKEVAVRRNLIVISGLEGDRVQDKLRNEAMVFFPDAKETVLQCKHRSSGYEPVSLYGGRQHTVFRRTAIGTFSVVICSDFLEADILDAIRRSALELHLLVVCACNPYPELFLQLGRADACRLYSYVAIANSCTTPETPASATAEGSVICEPFRQADRMVREAGDPIPLEGTTLAGATPAIQLFRLDLQGLVQGIRNVKPERGFLSPPHCRRAAEDIER